MNKYIQRGLILVGALVTSTGAMAVTTGPDLSALTAAVSFDTTTAAVLAIAALLAVVLVAKKGARMGLSMLSGG